LSDASEADGWVGFHPLRSAEPTMRPSLSGWGHLAVPCTTCCVLRIRAAVADGQSQLRSWNFCVAFLVPSFWCQLQKQYICTRS